MGIPTIYYFPFDAKKHGAYASLCNLNIRLLAAAQRMLEIHDTPLLCINWPTDRNGEIIVDGTENNVIMHILKSYVDSGFDKNCDGIKRHIEFMQKEYAKRLQIRPSYADLPPSVIRERTIDVINEYHLTDLPESIRSRQYTYLYRMDMTPDKCKRQDPYTGTTFIYDYIVCRTGRDVSEKKANLVLHFPNLTVRTWQEKNPNDLTTKSCNWYLTANLFILKDGYILVRG